MVHQNKINLTTSKGDIDNAENLLSTICRVGHLTRVPGKKSWTRDMVLLLGDLGGDSIRLKRVLDWYSSHAGCKFTPHVHSAKSFREKFLQIESVKKHKQDQTTEIKISKQARLIAHKLQTYHHWPKGFTTKLPEAAQISLDNWDYFKSRLNQICQTNKKCKSFSRYLFEEILISGNSCSFVQNWLEEAFNRVCDWDEWSGSVLSVVFSVKSKQFRKEFMRWVGMWCGDSKFGYVLLEALSV